MIDFENYERLTVKNIGKYTQIKDSASMTDCLKRLAELEELIENGKLVPKYCIVKDSLYSYLCVHLLINAPDCDYYENEEEAKQKLKELLEYDTE